MLSQTVWPPPPQLIDDEYLTMNHDSEVGHQPPDQQPKIAYFCNAMKLMEIYVGILKYVSRNFLPNTV